MKRLLATAVAFVASVATAIGGVDEEVAKARAEFEAIVGEAEAGVRMPHGDSPTKLVRDFLSHDAAIVREVESSAWKVSRSGKFPHAMAVEHVVHFLHGMPRRPDSGSLIEFGERTGLDVVAGVVVLRKSSGVSHSGPSMKVLERPFDQEIGATPTRTPPHPRAADLLAVEVSERSRDFEKPHWSESAVLDFGMALGEACAGDDQSFATLLGRAIDRPTSRHLLLALGWSRRPEAVEFLSRSLRDLPTAGWSRSSHAWIPTPLDSAVAALRHADEAAYQRVVADLTDEQKCRVVGEPKAVEIVRARMAAVEGAASAEDRRAATLRLCATVRSLRAMPGGANAKRLLHHFVAAVDGVDTAVRDAALDATETLLYGPVGREVASSILRLTNEGERSLAVNAAALRYGIAAKVKVTTTSSGASSSTQRFRLELGSLYVPCAASASCLVPLRRGGKFECDIPVLESLRGADSLDLRIENGFVVEDPSSTTILCFDWTRVR